MKIKVERLLEKQIDFAVARLLNVLPTSFDDWTQTWPHYCATSAGDAVIDQHGISVIRCDDEYGVDAKGFTTMQRIPVWAATVGQHSYTTSYEHQQFDPTYMIDKSDLMYGATRRQAAMKAFIAWKVSRNQWSMDLKAEIDIPEELL